MKPKNSLISPKVVDSLFTPFSLIVISIIAIISVAVALFQVNKGPVAPTAPQSLPRAADIVGQTCAVQFTVPGPTVTPIPTADLSLSKVVSNSTPNVGEQVTFTIEVHNAGPNTATGVAVGDLLPPGLTFVSANPSASYDQSSGIWTIGTIGVNSTASLQITATVDTNGQIVNTAEVISSDQPDVDSTPNNHNPDEDDQDSAVINSNQPGADLELTKSVDNVTPVVGNNITFTLTLINKGPDSTDNVTVADVLPNGVTYLSSNASQGSYDSATGVWTVGTLPADVSVTLDITVRVDQTGDITNYTQVTSSDQPDIDSTPNDNSTDQDDDDTLTVTVQPIATATPINTAAPTATPAPSVDLSLTKTVSNSTPNVGDHITYTVELYNAGPDTATGVSVKELLTGGVTFVKATPSQGSYDVNTGIWTVGTVNSTEVKTLEIEVIVQVESSITNVAEVYTSDQPDVDSTPNNNVPTEDDQDSATINSEQQGADLSLTKRVNNINPTVGQEFMYTIEVHNSGPRQADDVSVQDLILPGTTLIYANPSQGSYNSGNGVWTIGSITKDFTVRLELTVRRETASGLTNVAEVISSSQPDPDSTPNNHNPNEDDQDEAVIAPEVAPVLPHAGNTSKTTLFVIATGVIVLIIGAMGLLLLL